ncbi:MAG: hypothetical protein J6X66_01290 [Lachnospiraceae bacterium]|nr:hypothetical protein [Lachnospiraceae bacterium]
MPSTIRLQSQKKPKRLNFAQRREAAKRNEELISYGTALGEIKSDPGPRRFFLCFIRAALIFLASYGMLGGLVSAFGLAYSVPVVMIALFILAFITAFLYYNKLTFYVGYFLIFGAFIFFSLSFYWEINSGYMAFLSEVFQKYSTFFRVATPDLTEIIQNRYLTVTMAMIFMGWFFSILLNITISGYMDLFTTFLITILPLQIAFYVDIVPPLQYIMMLFASYIAVAVLGHSGRFTLPYKSNSGEDFSRRRAKKKTVHTYYSTSKGMLQVSVWSILLSVAFLLICGGLFASDISTQNTSNRVKDSTDDLIKKYLDGGFASLFDRYQGTGGLARGRLGGISNVSPDFQTDLYVRLVPGNYEAYLKSFTGVTYSSSSFLPDYFDTSVKGDEYTASSIGEKELALMDTYFPMISAYDTADMDTLGENNNYVSKMWISNVDADDARDYIPYFAIESSTKDSESETDTPRSGIVKEIRNKAHELYPDDMKMLDDDKTIMSYAPEAGVSRSYESLFMPFTMLTSFNPNPSVTKEYQDKVYDIYLQVPEDIRDELEEFCDEAGLYNTASYYRDLGSDEERPLMPADQKELDRYFELQQQRLAIAGKLKRYFASEFQYTLAPGATPRSRDVVTYFLNTQKRGYCAHFASSSAMLLRTMGIPTRYVEGYVMTMTDMMEGTPVVNSTEGWQTPGTAQEGNGIIEVELTDGSAHAWIEIYLDGYGWIPYEMTPPSDEAEPPVNLDFLSLFSGLFTTTNRNNGNNTAANIAGQLTQNKSSFAFLGSISFLLRPLGILLAALVVFMLSFPLIRFVREEYSIFRHAKQGEFSRALMIYYRRFIKKMIKCGVIEIPYPTIRDGYITLTGKGVNGDPVDKGDADTLRRGIEQAAYGNEQISEAEYTTLKKMIITLSGKIKKVRKKTRKKS